MNVVAYIQSLTEPALKIKRANLLRKLLFGYVIFTCFQMLPLEDTLYNTRHSIIATQNLHGFTLSTLVNLLSVESIKSHYLLFMGIQVLAAMIGLLGFFPRLTTFLVFFTTINLQNRIYSTITGGDILLCLLLFYLSFISDGKRVKNLYIEQIRNVSDHTFILLCQLQVLIVYGVSALYKWQSPDWLQGLALQKILAIDEYSLPFLQSAVCTFPLVFKIFSWLALLYQTLFPVLIFSNKVKKYVIITGIIFHLFIAIAMGLFNFSLIMICCYALFYDSKTKSKHKIAGS